MLRLCIRFFIYSYIYLILLNEINKNYYSFHTLLYFDLSFALCLAFLEVFFIIFDKFYKSSFIYKI